MKKWFCKIRLILSTCLLTLLLAGCSAGSTVETKLTINDDLSGSRVMELVINESVFDEDFSGSIEELNAVVTETCPSQLTWAYDDSTGTKIYRFTLDFTSIEDYKSKVDALIGEGSDVQITISKADSVWANGVYVEESFSSADILAWLKTMLVEKGFVSSSNSSKIFQLGECNVSYAGAEYSSGNTICIDEVEYLDINSIDLFTEVNSYDSYNKIIEISIPESSMTAKGEEIKSWLGERVPEGASSEWITEDTDSIFKVSKESMTAEQLQKFLNEYFDSDLCTVNQENITEMMSPFSFNGKLDERYDFSNYIIGDQLYYTDINYYIKGADGYIGGSDLDDLYYNADYYGSEEYDEYQKSFYIFDGNGLNGCTSYFQKVYEVSDVTIKSKIGLLGGLSREYTFTFEGEPTDDEKETIIEKIEALCVVDEEEQGTESLTTEESASEEDKQEWNVDIKDKVKEGVYTITLVLKGDRKELREASVALFGSSGDFYRTKDFSFAKLNYDVSVYDQFELGNFVDYKTEDVTATYILDTGLGADVEYVSNEAAQLDGAKVTIKDSNVLSGVNIITYGSQFNLWAVLFHILLIGGAVCIVIVLKKEGIIDRLLALFSKKRTEAVVQSPVVEMSVEDTPMFCEFCGAKRDADACVCTQCGIRFEN